ncbi:MULTISPECIES: SDR family NAD(P)-dependent oxidoreductase [unclassified Ruegeria]|uniref:SDR family NAD(P)-dependent oxidoreductase n=1 Tax=unclassified Ruegeria TaxID=2625375 RepID=UPI0014893AEC|nr:MULTISPECIES: SDR family oxidoreductase [unclassified Ruegeria]NOD37072.1 SDR family oxidoreductase [Ruegeria sp. HKCCD7296]NOD49944.1 SDR family oxidoreductase [Ruegeria sp. HKCCD5849]NOD54240.1 SDR family oxidoreductase [Ruegeria sp. HKCCD5851]NOD68934.1 SDR family oxidoreductase [Ruegeria sp. HKCCD7303]NOE35366.1 SDR family oxidoreductase [Ruegeria sp. HKCCD7318]
MSFSIAGKTAIVTGGANGIGLAIGRHFADAGANVMFADMDEKRLIDELGGQAEDGNIRYFAGDLREKLTIANLLSATLDAFDQVDILINGARQVIPSDPLDPDDDSVRTLLNQNLMPALRLSQLVSKRMIKQADGDEENPAGSIINLSSIAARRTHPDLMAYSVSTAALDQMTRSLAVALAPNRIRVNSIALGSVMSASLQSTLKENRDFRDDIEKHTPLARIASATELTETAQFLASDAAGFITGQILTIDGGRTLLDPVAAPAH